jgi:glucose/arabinose dehydrogenase
LLPEPFVRLAVADFWERGVVGVALHPRFPEEPFVYVHYVRKTPFIHHTVSRFTARGDAAEPESELVFIEGEDQSLKVGKYPGAHQGGAMRFGADGKLYVTIGEHNVRDPAQSLESLHGKILRFNPDGSIPEDNPFFLKAEGRHRAIYAIGLRNPFGLAVDPASGRMFITDVGQELFEEINEAAPGANYGWPIAEGLLGNRPEFKKPLHIYGRKDGTCISGGVFYRAPENASGRFPAEFEGKYFFADFMAGWIRVLDPEKPEPSAPFAKRIPGPVDLAVVLVPNKAVPAVLEECGQKGIKGAVIITAGFRETGKEGRALEQQLIAPGQSAKHRANVVLVTQPAGDARTQLRHDLIVNARRPLVHDQQGHIVLA